MTTNDFVCVSESYVITVSHRELTVTLLSVNEELDKARELQHKDKQHQYSQQLSAGSDTSKVAATGVVCCMLFTDRLTSVTSVQRPSVALNGCIARTECSAVHFHT